ncbi:MAG: hypothetical protein ABL873_01220, partial [Gallionella sp.]
VPWRSFPLPDFVLFDQLKAEQYIKASALGSTILSLRPKLTVFIGIRAYFPINRSYKVVLAFA